jgi:hypothetical protein
LQIGISSIKIIILNQERGSYVSKRDKEYCYNNGSDSRKDEKSGTGTGYPDCRRKHSLF